jgi:hypothetical protein
MALKGKSGFTGEKVARLAGIEPAAFGSGGQEKATLFSPIPGLEGVFNVSTVSQK